MSNTYRKLTDTEIALFRFGIWPCCGEKETLGGPRGTLMRNLKCFNCGTIVNVPSFVTDTETMRRLCEMIYHPTVSYNAEATALRVGLTPEMIKHANIIMSPAPHEMRKQRKLRWVTFPRAAKWVVKAGLGTMTAMLIAVTCWPGSIPERFFSMLFTAVAGMLVMVIGLRRIESK